MFFQKIGHDFPILFILSYQYMPTAWKCNQLRIGNVRMRVFGKIIIYKAVINALQQAVGRSCQYSGCFSGPTDILAVPEVI